MSILPLSGIRRLACLLAAGGTLAVAQVTENPAADKSAPVAASAPAAATPEVTATNAPVAPSDKPARIEILKPGDKLHFMIEEDPARSGPQEVIVSPLGDLLFAVSRNSDVSIPISSNNKTLGAIKQELKEKLDADYYVDCHLYLKIHEQLGQKGEILFSGQVRANILPLAPGERITLFEAMLKVGYTDFANLKKVVLHRKETETGKSTSVVFNVDAMIKGDRSKDIELKDGDHIEVREKTLVGL